ncbi:SDR family oxidoreductase [Anaerolineales bacterium]
MIKNPICLITGGGSGIGRATALRMAAQEGARVIVADVAREQGEATIAAINDNGGEAIFVPCDVSQSADVKQLFATIRDTYENLDYAVNAAGISGDLLSRVHDVDDEIFDRILSVNLKGLWLCMKEELRMMLENQQGAIVNIASVAGLIGFPKGAAYAASKHAVVGLTRSAAAEYARYGIRVNAVCPSFIDTPMVRDMINGNPAMADWTVKASPMKRLGTAPEIAAGILWLCSEESSFVNGHALAMDGGLSII